MSVGIATLRQKRRKIQIALAILWIPLGLYIIFQYRNGTLTKDTGIFWIAASLLPVILFDFIASLLTGESFAKGLSIHKERIPKLFFVNTIVSGLLLFACIIGVIIYW